MNTTLTENNPSRSSGAIKEGYKQTPVGVIPEDWDVKRLGKLISKSFSGTTPNRSEKTYYDEGVIPWIKSGELNQWNIFDTEEKITQKAFEETSLQKVRPNTIVYALYGATAGVVSETKIEATLNQAILAIYLKEAYSKNYIKYLLSFNKEKFINRYTQGGQPILNSSIVKNYNLKIPPLPEQKAIADCLSTWDNGIEKLTAIIQSKKEQKKGLMQQIFNGQLKMENGKLVKVVDENLWLEGWKEVMIKNLTDVFDGTHQTPKYVENGVPFYSVEHLTADDFENTKYISEKVFIKENKRVKLEKGDVLMT
ncbi:MAG: restriction endonuclease subunit S, partial [Psychroflexus sp.]|nr:restriction endonuclease subunit S [Psychroflexus sp.]